MGHDPKKRSKTSVYERKRKRCSSQRGRKSHPHAIFFFKVQRSERRKETERERERGKNSFLLSLFSSLTGPFSLPYQLHKLRMKVVFRPPFSLSLSLCECAKFGLLFAKCLPPPFSPKSELLKRHPHPGVSVPSFLFPFSVPTPSPPSGFGSGRGESWRFNWRKLSPSFLPPPPISLSLPLFQFPFAPTKMHAFRKLLLGERGGILFNESQVFIFFIAGTKARFRTFLFYYIAGMQYHRCPKI